MYFLKKFIDSIFNSNEKLLNSFNSSTYSPYNHTDFIFEIPNLYSYVTFLTFRLYSPNLLLQLIYLRSKCVANRSRTYNKLGTEATVEPKSPNSIPFCFSINCSTFQKMKVMSSLGKEDGTYILLTYIKTNTATHMTDST